MARPKRGKPYTYKSRRQTLAAQRKRLREQNRIKVIKPIKASPIQTGATLEPGPIKKLIPKIPTVKPRRVITTTSISRRDREILIVSRKGQPQVFATVKALERKSYPPKSVSSTWISTIGYFFNDKIGTFTTKTGRQYKILNFDFESFEEWFYANSKGTYWNDFIRDQYTIVGTL